MVSVGVSGITKRFGAVTAVNDVTLGFEPGRVHAVLGENGSGKSTLVKLLSGVYQPTAGTVTLDDQPVVLSDPHAASSQGIVTIFQQSQTVPDLTVAENIVLGRERSRFGVLSRRQSDEARAILESLEGNLALDQPVRTLSVAGQQLVSIARALSVQAKLLILDEPTAALGHLESEQLFTRIAAMRERGLAILYISHRMAEIARLADTVSVLKDGRLMATEPAAALTEDDMVRLMVGRELNQLFPDHPVLQDRVVLRASGLESTDGMARLDDLEVRAGEIVGLAGLEGSGRATLTRILGGVERPGAGTLTVEGRKVDGRSVRRSVAAGLSYVAPDRLHEGIVPAFSVRESASQSALPLLSRGPVLALRRERAAVARQTKRMRVKAASDDANIMTLSGGNQQKVMIARALVAEAKVLVMDEPTAGVDVGARGDIYAHLSSLLADGAAVVMSSADMVELIGMCHRILVVRDGGVVEEVPGTEATEERLMRAQLPRASTHLATARPNRKDHYS